MLKLGKMAYVLLLIPFLALAGCKNPSETGKAIYNATPQPVTNPSETGKAIHDATPQPVKNPQAINSDDHADITAQSSKNMGKATAVRLASPESGWVAGKGWIARTDDGGGNWSIQYVGNETISQIFALNGMEAWAVTDKTNLLVTSDGGTHWQEAGKMPNNGFLHFVSKNEAFSANARTTNGGNSWSTLNVPANIVGDAYFNDENNGWAVIQINGMGIIERTTDGGNTWQNVFAHKLATPLAGVVIRSAGTGDAWVEWIGGSGMTQTSYSLFHTSDGGKNWRTVLVNSTAGGGPAPGFPSEYNDGPKNQGSQPGPLYVVDRNVAFLGGHCPACDKPNTMGRTTDGGKTWGNGTASLPGYAGALLAIADANHGWWICTDNSEPSVMYTTSDGGAHWNHIYTFPRPK